ncbi:MAG: LPXTG cell wall anchor domain-containing protein [Clostridiales bacterium]|nr:LPXTG cell wall anchor domain-containing protein [Clostridiales bacterium]
MKTTKKILALLMAAMLIFAMTITASAEEPTTGSITITNATVGETYSAYKIFDATYESGDHDKVSYTYTKTGDSDAVYAALTAAGSPFTLAPTTTANVYNVTTTETDGAVIADWLKANVIDLLTAAAGPVEAATDTVTFSGLDFGYYYITSTLGSIVTLDTNNPTVNVIDKNQGGPVIGGKSIVEDTDTLLSSARFGDTISFKVQGTTTNYNGTDKVVEVFVNDAIDEGLTYDKTSLKVYIADSELDVDEDYTIVYAADDHSFKITIDMYDDANNQFLYDSPSDLVVTYDATLNTSAEIAADGNKNTANIDYRTENDTETETDTEYHKSSDVETVTYTYALAILKVDENGDALEGAIFSVEDADGNAVNVTATADAGVYNYDADSTSNLVTSPASGLIIIKGVDAGTYTITETQAPAEYNKLASPIDIIAALESTSTYTETITTYYDADGNVTQTEVTGGSSTTTTAPVPVVATTVQNHKGAELPTTGGIGTTIFYVVGGILVLGAAVLLITKKRMAGTK